MYDKLFLIFSKIFFEGEFEGVRIAFFARRGGRRELGERYATSARCVYCAATPLVPPLVENSAGGACRA